MTRPPLVSIWMVATVFGSGIVVAGEPSARPATLPAVSASAPTKPVSMSPAIAARLAAAAPKFEAATPAQPDATAPDARETDRPRNTIVRLPPYLVREKPAPTFKPRELLTAKGRLDLALDRHPGLRFGSFWIFRNDGVALEMLAEEERLERIKEMQDLLSLLPLSEEKKVKPAMEQSFDRQ